MLRPDRRLPVGVLAIAASLAAIGCGDHLAVVEPRGIHPTNAALTSDVSGAQVLVCKHGPVGTYTFNYSAATSPATTGTVSLTVTDPNSVPCIQVWDGTVGGFVDVTIGEVQQPSSNLVEIDLVDDVTGSIQSSNPATNGSTIDVTPVTGEKLMAVFFNEATPSLCPPKYIVSNFNGTPIAGGNYIWLNAVFKPKGVTSAGGTVNFTKGAVTITSGGTNYAVPLPPSTVYFSPTATSAYLGFDGVAWFVTVPWNYTGNIFLTGVPFQVPAGGLAGGANPVIWTESMSTNIPGLTLNWQWGAAVYTSFQTFYLDMLGVKPVDSGSLSAYLNSDHAGTPENYKTYVIGGARGGGGSNFTGSYSGTGSSTPCAQ